MGQKEWKRSADRDQALELVRSEVSLTPEQTAFVKRTYSGIGGLCLTEWSSGAFFTPQVVIRFIHDLLGIRECPGRVIELSCGGGAFFEGLDQRRVLGIEINRDSFRVARACYPDAELLNKAAEDVFPFDRPSEHDSAFAFCIGNPPYGIKMNWGGDITEGRLCKIPSEWAFMEMAVRAVSPGGRIGMVSDGLLSSDGALPLRNWLMERCYVRAVISLPTETFYFAGTGCKTSVLYLEKAEGPVAPDYKIFMAICSEIGWNSRGRDTGRCDLPAILDAYLFHAAGDDPGEKAFSEPLPALTGITIPVSAVSGEAASNDGAPIGHIAQMALF